jgi:hypothetical protein
MSDSSDLSDSWASLPEYYLLVPSGMNCHFPAPALARFELAGRPEPRRNHPEHPTGNRLV